MATKKDISGRFTFKEGRMGRYYYKEVSGELGVPGQVVRHDAPSENRALSAGTGAHASHMVGSQFGPPGDRRNATLGNPNINTYTPGQFQAILGKGGSYRELEIEWAAKLKAGYRVWARVIDVFRAGEKRPFVRDVEWIELDRNGFRSEPPKRTFGNFGSPQERAATQPDPPPVKPPDLRSTTGLLPLLPEEPVAPLPLIVPTANSAFRRMAGNQAGVALLGQKITELSLWLGHLGIERQVRKDLETTHAETIRDIQARGDGVLVIVRIQICAMNPDTPRTEELLSTSVVGGRTYEEALDRWIHEPKITAGADVNHDIEESYAWIPATPAKPPAPSTAVTPGAVPLQPLR